MFIERKYRSYFYVKTKSMTIEGIYRSYFYVKNREYDHREKI